MGNYGSLVIAAGANQADIRPPFGIHQIGRFCQNVDYRNWRYSKLALRKRAKTQNCEFRNPS